ncbi:hypothetical protein [Kribbella shirazensis]|uniref:Uncharacterized protein n=1 Tax=Kribbella shirazensis TaxID=1105143 RepID=A0A7X5V487_9ACTN|nr:hypothetical protein [Kribbella shirazensis]NIK54326.1 hypothetical protein [Kribbella shirazensis]
MSNFLDCGDSKDVFIALNFSVGPNTDRVDTDGKSNAVEQRRPTLAVDHICDDPNETSTTTGRVEQHLTRLRPSSEAGRGR